MEIYFYIQLKTMYEVQGWSVNLSSVEPQISHFANSTPCEELVLKRHFWKKWNSRTANFDNFVGQTSMLIFLLVFNCVELVRILVTCEGLVRFFQMWRIGTQFLQMWRIGASSSHLWRIGIQFSQMWRISAKCSQVWKIGTKCSQMWKIGTKFSQIWRIGT